MNLTISERRSIPLAVEVKCWSKAKVDVEVLWCSDEGPLRVDAALGSSIMHFHTVPACTERGCQCGGSCLLVLESGKDTHLGNNKVILELSVCGQCNDRHCFKTDHFCVFQVYIKYCLL